MADTTKIDNNQPNLSIEQPILDLLYIETERLLRSDITSFQDFCKKRQKISDIWPYVEGQDRPDNVLYHETLEALATPNDYYCDELKDIKPNDYKQFIKIARSTFENTIAHWARTVSPMHLRCKHVRLYVPGFGYILAFPCAVCLDHRDDFAYIDRDALSMSRALLRSFNIDYKDLFKNWHQVYSIDFKSELGPECSHVWDSVYDVECFTEIVFVGKNSLSLFDREACHPCRTLQWKTRFDKKVTFPPFFDQIYTKVLDVLKQHDQSCKRHEFDDHGDHIITHVHNYCRVFSNHAANINKRKPFAFKKY